MSIETIIQSYPPDKTTLGQTMAYARRKLSKPGLTADERGRILHEVAEILLNLDLR